MDTLTAIPVVDLRAGGPVAHARAQREALDELRRHCFDHLPGIARPLVPVADAVARRWLNRNASPYRAEVSEIARIAEGAGVFLANTAYECACTAASLEDGRSPPQMLRTLDWPFAGLGRGVEVTRQAGPAGEFWNVTWPGAVGVLSALAPGRFAVVINQAPLYRRTRGEFMRHLDYAANALHTLCNVRHPPSAHVLREVFETARDYDSARDMLARLPMARPTLFALIGARRGESCLIERTEEEANVVDGPFVVANDWQEPRPNWESRFCGDVAALDSRRRSAALAARLESHAAPFDWLVPPVHNWATRLAVELNAADGTLRVVGFEPIDRRVPARQATSMLDLALERVAA